MNAHEKIMKYLPKNVSTEVIRLASIRGSIEFVSEIRLRSNSRSIVTVKGERLPLAARLSSEELSDMLVSLCDGSLYAYRDSIRDGYVSPFSGVRIGISGQARYDGDMLVGVSSVTGLTVRLPTEPFFDAEALYSAWLDSRGMLIYSPPGIGKTTALRSLAALIGKGCERQTVIVDERCEFIAEDYRSASVDILRGYKRADGMAIALRSLSPDVIIVDEIGRREEAFAMLDSLNSGVRIVATAHAFDKEELKRRSCMLPFFENRIFDTLVGISVKNGIRTMQVERIGCEIHRNCGNAAVGTFILA